MISGDAGCLPLVQMRRMLIQHRSRSIRGSLCLHSTHWGGMQDVDHQLVHVICIRNKILMLVILGIIGVASISGFAKYSAIKKNTYMRVLQQSQNAKAVMLQIMMAEEKFINTLDKSELSSLDEYKKNLNEALNEIRSFDVGTEIASDAANMSQTEAEHDRIFQMIAQGLSDISKAKSDLITGISSVNTNLKKVLDAIEEEETALFYQGVAGLSGGKVANGKMTLPFSVGGTFSKPKFSLKGGAGQSGASRAAQQPANLVRGLSGLFKKKQQ